MSIADTAPPESIPQQDPVPLTRGRGHTLGDQVVGSIIRMIADGRLQPGQRLVEVSIARELGVGTVPVREALRILSGDGVVEIRPNRGAVLRRLGLKDLTDMLRAVAGLVIVALDAMDRDAIDPIIPRLNATATRMMAAAAKRDAPAALRCGAQYLRILIVAADNRYILRTVDRVHFDLYVGALAGHADTSSLPSLVEPYRDLTRALAQHDIAHAQAIFRSSVRHLESTLG